MSLENLLARGSRDRSRGIDPCRHGARARSMPGRRSSKCMAASGSTGPCRPRSARRSTAMPVLPRIALDWSLAASACARTRAQRCITCRAAERRRRAIRVRLPALAATLNGSRRTDRADSTTGDIAQDIVDTIAPRGSFLALDGFRGASRRGSGADLVELSRSRHRRIAAERAGAGRARAAQHSRTLRHDGARSARARSARISRSKRRASPMRCATRISPIRPSCTMAVPRLLDRGFAADLAGMIDRTRRSDLPQAPGPRGDTTLVTVVDRDRNAVSIINSLFTASARPLRPRRPGSCCTIAA